jgi:hypothetical protein
VFAVTYPIAVGAAVSIKIFLSVISDEFHAYRDQLRSDLTRQNVETKVEEHSKDYGVVTLDKLDICFSACDAVIPVVGDMIGAPPKSVSTKAILAKYPDLPESGAWPGDLLHPVGGLACALSWQGASGRAG